MLEALPEECLSHAISFTSSSDACQLSLVSSSFRNAADSDTVWEKFLPPDYCDIISRSVSPVHFSSYKDLFRQLSSSPLLIDDGKKSFSIDRYTNKKCYMLSARELSIAWSTDKLCWCWKPVLWSRFPEAVELIMVHWLEIKGSVRTTILSPNTTYGAYLVVQISNRAFKLNEFPSEVSLEVGDHKARGTVFVKRNEWVKDGTVVVHEDEKCVPRERSDGWLEIELGEFYNHGTDEEVKMAFGETNGVHLKGGLVVEGIELRPKGVNLSEDGNKMEK